MGIDIFGPLEWGFIVQESVIRNHVFIMLHCFYDVI